MYRTEAPAAGQAEHFIADAQAIGRHDLVIIERDGTLTPPPSRASSGSTWSTCASSATTATLVKQALLDMVHIPDPNDVCRAAIHAGDIGLDHPFAVLCESIEALRPLGDGQLLLGCDNNFPNTSRNPNFPDDNEFVVVDVPALKLNRRRIPAAFWVGSLPDVGRAPSQIGAVGLRRAWRRGCRGRR